MLSVTVWPSSAGQLTAVEVGRTPVEEEVKKLPVVELLEVAKEPVAELELVVAKEPVAELEELVVAKEPVDDGVIMLPEEELVVAKEPVDDGVIMLPEELEVVAKLPVLLADVDDTPEEKVLLGLLEQVSF